MYYEASTKSVDSAVPSTAKLGTRSRVELRVGGMHE